MPETKAKIQEELKTAMKNHEQHKVITLRGLMAAIKQYEVDKRVDAGEETVLETIRKEIKKRRETLKYAEQEKREDLILQNNTELEILQGFLGVELGEEELRKLISELVSSGCDSIGKVMGALNKDYKGRFDGRLASELVKASLA